MNAIVTVDNNWGIGYCGRNLVNIPSDLKRLQGLIEDKVVVIGRKSFEAFPKQVALLCRAVIVISGNEGYSAGSAVIVSNIDELLTRLNEYNTDDIYVIGGESVYNSLIDKCNRVYVTKIDYKYTTDAYFHNLDKDNNWTMVFEDEESVYFDVTYNFTIYERK